MKAVFISRHGAPDVLEYGQRPTPNPGKGEVLVRVRACAVNHLDLWVRMGMPGVTIPLPHILGCDIAGTVEALKQKPKNLHVCLTGRNAPKELVEIADLVTEMKEIKHPFQKGIVAQRGIEF